tara:strand:- start:42 stop:365 length:324 start_codon:yes stop_codon:yes gene_type:complete
MNRKRLKLEFFSLSLVMSYLLIHRIELVFIGIIISLFEMKKHLIYNFIKSPNNIKSSIEKNKIESDINKDSKHLELNTKESQISLAEAIDELGFIPSLENDKNRNAA